MERDEDFAEYVSARRVALTRSAVLLGCSPHEAEDLVQTTLMRCYASWDKVVRAQERDAYVYRVMVNLQSRSRRRRWWGEQPTGDLPEQAREDPTARVDEVAAVRLALAALSPIHRAAVVLRYYAQLSEAETAQALGIAPGTVKSRLSRALVQLAHELDTTHAEAEASHE